VTNIEDNGDKQVAHNLMELLEKSVASWDDKDNLL